MDAQARAAGDAVGMSPLSSRALSLDIVIPVFNEEAVIDALVERLRATFAPEALALHGVDRFRVLFVDDGSRDRTAAMIADHIRAGLPAVCLRLTRNFGHQAALSAGLDHADADLVAVMDADLQDPPELIWEMLGRLREGYHVAYAQRRDRQEGPIKRLGYWAFYRMLAVMSDIEIPLDSGDFCLMTRPVVEAMRSLPERLRFPRVLRAWVGFRQVGVEYARSARELGVTKYSWSRLYHLATDGLASATTRPLRMAQVLACAYFLAAAALTLSFVVFHSQWAGAGLVFLLFLLLVVTVSGFAMMMLCIYILGAYISRLYIEVKARPTYLILETIGAAAAPTKGTA